MFINILSGKKIEKNGFYDVGEVEVVCGRYCCQYTFWFIKKFNQSVD